MDVLLITLPIFSLILLGWGGVRLGLFDAQVGTGLSRFVFWLAFPALLLSSMAKAPAPDASVGQQLGLWLLVLLGFQLVARLVSGLMGMDKSSRAGVAMAATCGNTAFLGTSVLTGLMGPSILPVVAAFVAVENIVVVALAVAGLKLAKGEHTSPITFAHTMAKGLANPTSIGALIGFVIALSPWDLPVYLARPLELLGGAASPAGLVALGIVMATHTGSEKGDRLSILLSIALKTVALPSAMLLAFWSLGMPPQITIIAGVLAACPSAVNVFIQARQADIWAPQAAQAVFMTTIASIVSVSVVAGLW